MDIGTNARTRACVGDDGVVLAFQVFDERRRHADRSNEVRRDRVDQAACRRPGRAALIRAA